MSKREDWKGTIVILVLRQTGDVISVIFWDINISVGLLTPESIYKPRDTTSSH